MGSLFVVRRFAAVALLSGSTLIAGCSGYNLQIRDATVTQITDSYLHYRIVLENAEGEGLCGSMDFYGYCTMQAYLADAPTRDASTLTKEFGGFGQTYLFPDQDDPSGKRVWPAGLVITKDFGCALDDDFSIERMPYMILELRSGEDDIYYRRGGTGPCRRYGSNFTVDLREFVSP